jgi:indole-3-glycerol phosphate synthase
MATLRRNPLTLFTTKRITRYNSFMLNDNQPTLQEKTPLSALSALATMQPRPLPSLNIISDNPLLIGHIMLEEIYDPISSALKFVQLGLDAVSLFTDNTIYSRANEDLLLLSRAMKQTPVISQNYILNQYSLLENRASGVSGIVLRPNIVDETITLRRLASYSHRLRLTIILKIDSHEQVSLIDEIAPHAVCVGTNSLYQSAVDLPLIETIRPLIPSHVRFFPYGAITKMDDLEQLLTLKLSALQLNTRLINTRFKEERLRATLDCQ